MLGRYSVGYERHTHLARAEIICRKLGMNYDLEVIGKLGVRG